MDWIVSVIKELLLIIRYGNRKVAILLRMSQSGRDMLSYVQMK